MYNKEECSVLQYISRKRKPTHGINSLHKMDYKEVTTVPFLNIFIFVLFYISSIQIYLYFFKRYWPTQAYLT